MKVSGFTFVRNAVKYDYPVTESIRSILPVCDEMIVAVGKSDDNTLDLIQSIGDPKIKIIETVWNDNLREGGKVLAIETDKAFDAISPDSTWAFYIQADEVVHEQYHSVIRQTMEQWEAVPEVEGLLFRYTHFYGSYQYTGDSRKWYRNEIRIVRNDKHIRSWLDAQGFRKNGRKLNVARVNASIYHYGWVKPPIAQQAKLQSFHKYWHTDTWIEKSVPKVEGFDYRQKDFLAPFTGAHPAVMSDRIGRQDWEFDPGKGAQNHSVKALFLRAVEKHTGWRPGEYRNYHLVK